MSRRSTLTATTAVAALCLASPALADLTPAQAWASLKDQMSASGYTVTGTETLNSDGLMVTDAQMSLGFDLPDSSDLGSVEIDLGDVALIDLGDGGVRVEFTETVQIHLDLANDEGEEVAVTVNYDQDGLDMVLTGDPDAVLYNISADVLRMELASIEVDGDPVTREELAVTLDFNGVSAQNTFETGDMARSGQDWDIGSIVARATFEVEDTKETGSLEMVYNDIQMNSEGVITDGADLTNLATMLDSGMSGSLRMAHGDTSTTFLMEGDGGPVSVTSRNESGLLLASLEDGLVSFATGTKGIETEMMGVGIPFPVRMTAAETSMNLMIPILPTDEAMPFNLGLTLKDFAVSDMIWDLLDPGRVLPRDPATLIARISGAARLLVDVTDPEQMEELDQGDVIPGEIENVSIDSFELSAVGARVTGEGGFTFDSEDLDTFSGLPRPSGEVAVHIDGAQALIDNLIMLGLLSEENALGARMALTMFAVPGEGPDSLSSRLVVTEDGQVLANGMRVR